MDTNHSVNSVGTTKIKNLNITKMIISFKQKTNHTIRLNPFKHNENGHIAKKKSRLDHLLTQMESHTRAVNGLSNKNGEK